MSAGRRTIYRLRPRHGNDLAALTELWVASWQATLPIIDFAARAPWFAAHIETIEGEGGQTICVVDAQACLAGFVLLVVERSYIEQIAVHPGHFGGGAAVCLLDAAKALCPGGLTLDVNADNPRALRFYEREGFARLEAGRNPRSGLATWRLSWSRPSDYPG